MPSCPVHVSLLLPVLLYFLNEINVAMETQDSFVHLS